MAAVPNKISGTAVMIPKKINPAAPQKPVAPN